MGIINVTPDSFADGGLRFDHGRAIEDGWRMLEDGADILDIGGESTRPGAEPLDADEELRRVLPVVEALGASAVVSIDTYKAVVAGEAIARGAAIVNDVSALRYDPALGGVTATAGAAIVLMHNRGRSRDMYREATYDDVMATIAAELSDAIANAEASGVGREAIILDPGLGFAKLAEHNWALLTHLGQIASLGGGHVFPVLIGASRKRFLGRLLAAPDGSPRPFAGSDDATVAVTALAAAAGAWCARVHEVPANADAVRVGEAWREAAGQADAAAGAGTAAGAGGAAGAGAAAGAPSAGGAGAAGWAGAAGRAGGAGSAGEGG